VRNSTLQIDRLPLFCQRSTQFLMDRVPPKSPSGVLGLDAGTTRWVLWDENGVMKDPMGDTTTPAFIGWTNGRFVFGTVGRAKAVKFPHMTYDDLKRLLGVKYYKGLAPWYADVVTIL
jgi:molecular chaperone DnaK (HSP70)